MSLLPSRRQTPRSIFCSILAGSSFLPLCLFLSFSLSSSRFLLLFLPFRENKEQNEYEGLFCPFFEGGASEREREGDEEGKKGVHALLSNLTVAASSNAGTGLTEISFNCMLPYVYSLTWAIRGSSRRVINFWQMKEGPAFFPPRARAKKRIYPSSCCRFVLAQQLQCIVRKGPPPTLRPRSAKAQRRRCGAHKEDPLIHRIWVYRPIHEISLSPRGGGGGALYGFD